MALVAGVVVGSMVNMALVNAGTYLIPLPGEADIATVEGLRETIHLYRPVNFLFPFLGHALGTFAGALLAALIVPSGKMYVALSIGLFFLIGGIAMAMQIPAPLWFTVTDLIVAYIPMALAAGYLAYLREKK